MKIRFKVENSAIFKDWSVLTISDDTEIDSIKNTINTYCNNFLGVFNVRKDTDIVWEEVSDNCQEAA